MSQRLRIAGFVYEPDTGALTRRGQTQTLPYLSARVLGVLVRHAPNTVSAETLVEEAWGRKIVSEDTLTQRMKLLRQAFAESAQDARIILTVRGEGYRLGVPVEEASNASLPLSPKVVICGAVAAVAVLAVLGWTLASSLSEEPAIPQAQSADTDPVMRRVSTLMALHQADETARAVNLLREARAEDPERVEYAIALSVALSTTVTKFAYDRELALEAETLARTATEQSPQTGAAWHALGYSLDSQSRISEALAAYQQAYLLDPSNANAMSSAAYLLSVRGQLYDALVLDLRALQAGGGSLYGDLQIGRTLNLLGERELADRWLNRALQINADHPVVTLGVIEIDLARGDIDVAAARLDAFPPSEMTDDLRRVSGQVAVGRGDVVAGRVAFDAAGPAAVWERAIQTALSGESSDEPYLEPDGVWPSSRIHAARLAAAQGDQDAAFYLLNEAVSLGWRGRQRLETQPVLSVLSKDPRWGALLDRIEREVDAQRALFNADASLKEQLETQIQ